MKRRRESATLQKLGNTSRSIVLCDDLWQTICQFLCPVSLTCIAHVNRRLHKIAGVRPVTLNLLQQCHPCAALEQYHYCLHPPSPDVIHCRKLGCLADTEKDYWLPTQWPVRLTLADRDCAVRLWIDPASEFDFSHWERYHWDCFKLAKKGPFNGFVIRKKPYAPKISELCYKTKGFSFQSVHYRYVDLAFSATEKIGRNL